MDCKEKRVVITGIGVISPNGKDKNEFWHSCLNGISGIKPIKTFDVKDFSTKIGGVIENFDTFKYINFKEAKRMSKFSQLALVASKMAIEDANLEIKEENRNDIGIIIGVSVNGVEIIEREVSVLKEKGAKSMSPFGVAGAIPNAAAANIAINLGIKGRVLTISTGCSSALNAIGYAYELIKYGKANILISGGTEAPITPSVLGAFCAGRILSTRNNEPEKASRPFDKYRDGYLLSEGSAIFVMENLESALKRNAKVYAEIIGFANTSDSYSMYKMDTSEEGVARAMAFAINEANISIKEVNYINAHGSSSYLADIKETRAIKRVFGDYAKKIKVSSVKSMIGHPLGAAGGMQLAETILAGENGYIPPTINYEKKDPECDLDYVPNIAERKKIKVAIINSFGMGGNNSSLAVRIF